MHRHTSDGASSAGGRDVPIDGAPRSEFECRFSQVSEDSDRWLAALKLLIDAGAPTTDKELVS
jgi:hypothetical protein